MANTTQKPGWFKRLQQGVKTLFQGAGGSGNQTGRGLWPQWFLPGAKFDYVQEAGDLWLNSAVMACCKWAGKTFPEAPPRVVSTPNPEGKRKEQMGHRLTQLLRKPNAYYSGNLLLSAVLLSLMVDGNAYILKDRNVHTGKVVALWYVPHWMMAPAWPVDGSEYLACYEYRVNGKTYNIPTADVVHFRDGLDPNNYRKGLSPLVACLREIVTDNDAATYSAAIVRNMGIPGVVIVPFKGDTDIEIDDPTREDIAAKWKTRTTGERRGEALVLSVPMDLKSIGFSPKDIAIDKLRQLPEERICAVLNIPPIVVGLGAGLARSTFANFKEAREAAYESFIVPMQRLISEEINTQLLPDLGDPDREEMEFDTSKVRAFQEDENERHARYCNDYQAGVCKRSEARSALGYEVDETLDDVYITDLTTAQPEDEAQSESEANRATTAAKSRPGTLVRVTPWMGRIIAEIRALERKR